MKIKEDRMDLANLKIRIAEKLKETEYSLYDLEYVHEHRTNILRVMIDKPQGIDIEDCVAASDVLNPLLDELDPIADDYSLEVSSPGAERKLRNPEEIIGAIGKFVHVETYEQKVEGELLGFKDGFIFLKIRNKSIEIAYLDVLNIRLAIKM
jgi:ribosome maturation factor RimP